MKNKYAFSKKSLDKLKTCHRDLQTLAHEVMKLQLFDFGIACGFRSKKDQEFAIQQGKSLLKEGKHNVSPSKAMDVFVVNDGLIEWNNYPSWYMAIGVFIAVAKQLGIQIRCGADWDGDFDTRDQTFNDIGHIELI